MFFNNSRSQEVKQCLQDIFMEGKIIFFPKNSVDEVEFGDIFIKPIENTEHTSYEQNRSNKINLKAELLKKGFVTESQSYMEGKIYFIEIKKHSFTITRIIRLKAKNV